MKLQTCSLAARGVTYDEVEAGYYEQVEALYEGGVDLFLVETIFDTLNAKAALFALERFFAEKVGWPSAYVACVTELRTEPAGLWLWFLSMWSFITPLPTLDISSIV